MKDTEIESILIKSATGHKDGLGSDYQGIVPAYWDINNNRWQLCFPEYNPLAALLIEEKVERYQLGDDDYQVASVAKYLDRPTWWIESFHYGWTYQSNESMSISGYILARNLRNLYEKC